MDKYVAVLRPHLAGLSATSRCRPQKWLCTSPVLVGLHADSVSLLNVVVVNEAQVPDLHLSAAF
jgi:hypothetical protein